MGFWVSGFGFMLYEPIMKIEIRERDREERKEAIGGCHCAVARSRLVGRRSDRLTDDDGREKEGEREGERKVGEMREEKEREKRDS